MKRVDVSTDPPHAELGSLKPGTPWRDLVLTVLKGSKHIFEQISETVNSEDEHDDLEETLTHSWISLKHM